MQKTGISGGRAGGARGYGGIGDRVQDSPLLGGTSRRLFEGGDGGGDSSRQTRVDGEEDDEEDALGGGDGVSAFLRRSFSALSRAMSHRDIRPQLRMAVILHVLQQAVGMKMVMKFGPAIVQAAGVAGSYHTYHLALAVACVSAIGSLLGVAMIDWKGRRFLMLASLAGCIVALVVLGGGFADVESGPSSPVSEMAQGSCAAAMTCRDCLAGGCGFCTAGGPGAPGRCMAGSAIGPEGGIRVLAAAAAEAKKKERHRHRSFIHHHHERFPPPPTFEPGTSALSPPTPAPPLGEQAMPAPPSPHLEALAEVPGLGQGMESFNGTGTGVEQVEDDVAGAIGLLPPLPALPPTPFPPSPPPPRARHRSHQNIVTCDGNWQYHACPSRLGLGLLAAQMLYVLCFQAGASSVPWVVAAEIFPMDVRGSALALAAAVNWAANFTVALVFPAVFKEAGGAVAFGALLLFALVGWVYTCVVMPETRSMSPAEVGAVMQAGSGGGGGESERGGGRVGGGTPWTTGRGMGVEVTGSFS